MSVEGRREMTARIAQWENELWSYLDKGDGILCPIHRNCQVRQWGGACPTESKQLRQDFKRFRSIKLVNPKERFGIISSNADYANLLKHWTPGKILQLVLTVSRETSMEVPQG